MHKLSQTSLRPTSIYIVGLWEWVQPNAYMYAERGAGAHSPL